MPPQPGKSPSHAKTAERPPLPLDLINPYLEDLKPPAVKFQEIMRDGQTTIVGRVKIPTPNGHAFILRRLDTGAISLTTMFRAAFPSATEDAEREESAWVKANYDTSRPNKGGKARFAGTWVSPDVAVAIADSYLLGPVIEPLAYSKPDPNIVYRKSQRSLQDTPTSSPAQNAANTPKDVQPRAKRRREASPAPPTPPQPAGITTPTSAARASSTLRALPASTPATRRSARLKSPAPPSVAKTPKSSRTKQIQQEDARTPPGSDETAVDDDVTEVTKVAAPNMEEDIREQKELIERLKAEKAEFEANKQAMINAGVEDVAEGLPVGESTAQKRLRDEQTSQFKLNIKEPETEQRALVTNSRIKRLIEMPPERKSLAWGAVLFAAGMGAVSLLPTLPSFF